jgi:uncharacterized protein YecE (DUF72 family)
MTKLFVGTSGWVYSHWKGIFYPEDLPSKDRLSYFSKFFKTTEVNYSFYHLPRPTTYQKWYSQTPKDFLFAVKASRFITHIKRLKGVREAFKQFLENALNLKEKLGPILFQFPPSFKADSENLKRLKNFLKYLNTPTLILPLRQAEGEDRGGGGVRCAFEFRHKSWFDDKIYKLLKGHNIAWVIADSSRYPRADVVTSDFVYIRMHGPGALFSSKYSKEQLKNLAQKIKKWLKTCDIFVYFNNDFHGFAIENAKELLSFLK